MAHSVRIGPEDHKLLRQLSDQTHRPMGELMSDAIADLRRKFIFDATNQGYLELKRDAKAAAADRAEQALWELAQDVDATAED